MSMSTSVQADGRRAFLFTMEWREKQLNNFCLVDDASRTAFVDGQVGRMLGERHWCEQGWQITDRTVNEQIKGYPTLMVTGQCK